MRGGSANGRPPNSASHAATMARFSRHFSSEIGGRIESHSDRNVPRSCSRPYGRARNHRCRCAEPSPHRFTWTRATPSSERTARSRRTVITPSSAASRFGRSPRSRWERDSRIRTIGRPVGRSMARTRHRSPTQMYASSGALQAVHSRSASPRRGGSNGTGSSSCLTRRSPSKGKDGHWVKSGTEGGVSGTTLTLTELATPVPTCSTGRPPVVHRVVHRLPRSPAQRVMHCSARVSSLCFT